MADAPVLFEFTCETYREPWSKVAQEMIREHLSANLEIGVVSGIGIWMADDLCGVAAWRADGDIWRSVVLAVHVGWRRRGLGGLLKDTMISEARDAGMTAIVSYVHWDNEAMMELNARRGATIERVPGDFDYCVCIVPVPS